MTLNLFLDWFSYHLGGWRMPGTRTDPADALSVQIDMAQQAERAKIHAIFVADISRLEHNSIRHPMSHKLEPFVMLGALAVKTEKIGLITTASTSFMEPYNLARAFSTLDHMSHGRAGWNIVTSFNGYENFGLEPTAHDDRYLRAYEYMDVVTQLWDSWSDDAVANDKENGSWTRPEEIHSIDFHGKDFHVAGPLNIARSPQGWPVFVQAGASDTGMDFAARYADEVFTIQGVLDRAQDFYKRMKEKTERAGRDPSKLYILPGLHPIIGDTETAARRLAEQLVELVDLQYARNFLAYLMGGVRLDDLELDEPIPLERLPSPDNVQGDRGRYVQYYKWAVGERRTLRELSHIAVQARGHLLAVGSAEQVADTMEEWFTQGGCDGFQLQPPYVMDGLDRVTNELIPILQERDLFQTDYVGTTLRDHLGLVRPTA
jgi:FMN-dependent oxidoreductase (nitrilotriacetate monooxygenase family)